MVVIQMMFLIKKQLDTKIDIPTIFSIPEDGETRTVIESKLTSFNGISLLSRLMLVQESDFMFNVKLKDIYSVNISVLNQDAKINNIKIPDLGLLPSGGASSSSRTMAFIDFDQTFTQNQTFANPIIQNQPPTLP